MTLITVFGREIEIAPHVREFDGSRYAVVYGLVGRIGRGVANYPTSAHLYGYATEAEARKTGRKAAQDSDGRWWGYHHGVTIRNRQARIVGWADRLGVTNYDNQKRVQA